ncbi:unnamed protein product [Linum trigynum]|uniref:Uncharacterized protein n=1 Tax=Linum trigynum TaxID=586398 RepID=A0AAV2CFT7_9ROSI
MCAPKRAASFTSIHDQLPSFTVLVTVNSPCVSNLHFGSGRLAIHGPWLFFTVMQDRELPWLAVNWPFFTSSLSFRSFSPIFPIEAGFTC